MLRIDGADLDLDALLRDIGIVPESSYRRGDPVFRKKPEGARHEKSGAGFLVSGAGFDEFDLQKRDAIAFLKKHRQALNSIMDRADVEGGVLDFGISRRDVVVQNDSFSPNILRAIAHFGFGLNLSHYPMLDNDESQCKAGIGH